MLSNVKGETYEDKLKDAGLTILKERRESGDVIQTFKVLKGFNKVDTTNNGFEQSPTTRDPQEPRRCMVDSEKVVKKELVLAMKDENTKTCGGKLS